MLATTEKMLVAGEDARHCEQSLACCRQTDKLPTLATSKNQSSKSCFHSLQTKLLTVEIKLHLLQTKLLTTRTKLHQLQLNEQSFRLGEQHKQQIDKASASPQYMSVPSNMDQYQSDLGPEHRSWIGFANLELYTNFSCLVDQSYQLHCYQRSDADLLFKLKYGTFDQI